MSVLTALRFLTVYTQKKQKTAFEANVCCRVCEIAVTFSWNESQHVFKKKFTEYEIQWVLPAFIRQEHTSNHVSCVKKMHLLININGSHENLIGSICNACLLLTKQNKNTQRPERNQNVTFCWHKSGRKKQKEKASLITYKTETYKHSSNNQCAHTF